MSKDVELRIEDAAKKTAEYLYSISADCPPELASAIDMLRQLINEAYVHDGKMISSQAIWDALKPATQAHTAKAVAEARQAGYEEGLAERKRVTPTHRHKISGTLYLKVVEGGGGLATVRTVAGSNYIVRMANIEPLTSNNSQEEAA
jgi:hypothetical protein